MVFLTLKKLLLRVDAHIEVIKQQVVIGAVGTIGAAQNVGSCRRARGENEAEQQVEKTERFQPRIRNPTTVMSSYCSAPAAHASTWAQSAEGKGPHR